MSQRGERARRFDRLVKEYNLRVRTVGMEYRFFLQTTSPTLGERTDRHGLRNHGGGVLARRLSDGSRRL